MPVEKILLLEDEPAIRKSLEQQLRYREYSVAAVDNLATARAVLAKDSFDLVLAAVRLPDGDGLELLKQLQSRPQKPLIVMMCNSSGTDSAVECIRLGAFDCLTKPFSAEQLEIVLKKAAQFTQLVKVNQHLCHRKDHEEETLLGSDPAMLRLRDLIRKVSRTDATVLIQGESGTGKELVARAIYRQSARSGAPFIAVNCAAVPENLIESEFFGHEKGAFTGAMTKREGRFELAHGGTLLLDEVSEVTPQIQAKLLRVLQEREIQRVGGDRTIHVDVRVIATTNRNLQESIQRREFREDLFFRLNVVPIYLPPLRDRPADLPLLAHHFVNCHVRKHGAKSATLTPGCLAALRRHHWPGNVRELQNVLERAVIVCGNNGLLREEHLGLGETGFTSARETVVNTQIEQRTTVPEIVTHRANQAEVPIPVLPSSGDRAGDLMSETTPEPHREFIQIVSEPTETSDTSPVETGEDSSSVRHSEPAPFEVVACSSPPPGDVDASPTDGNEAAPSVPFWTGSDPQSGRLATLAEVERRLIFMALARCDNNRTHAAKMIGISLRTLRNKLAEYRGLNGGITPSTQEELSRQMAA